MESKFKEGDKVRVINYGKIVVVTKKDFKKDLFEKYKIFDKDDSFYYIDIRPDLINKEDEISNFIFTKGRYLYILSDKWWFNEDQLELIK